MAKAPLVESTGGTQAVDRAAALLTLVIEADEPVTFAELSEATGLARSTLSRILNSLEANRLLAARMKQEGAAYPLHLGVTEAGDGQYARVKSTLGIGTLLAEGIGDTIRVSLTEDPVQEIPVCYEILQGLGLIAEPLPLLYNLTGVVVGMVHVLLPFMILPLYSVMKGIDPSLMAAARNLGGTPAQAFRRVFLPLTYPGIGAGMLMVFMLSIGYFVTPALLGGLKETFIAQLIEQQVTVLIDWSFAAALAILLLAVTLLIYYGFNRMLGLDRIWGGV